MDKIILDEWGNVIIQEGDKISFSRYEDYPEYMQRELEQRAFDY